MIFVATVTTFFGPAEASMIPFLVPRRQLLAANGLFTLTMNAAFALGFALVGPFLIALASPQALILIVAFLYFVAAAVLLDPAVGAAGRRGHDEQGPGGRRRRARRRDHVRPADRGSGLHPRPPVRGMVAVVPRDHRCARGHSCGPGVRASRRRRSPSARRIRGRRPAAGTRRRVGIVALNAYGHRLPRRRTIEAGMIALGHAAGRSGGRGPDFALPREQRRRPDRQGEPRRVGAVAGRRAGLPDRLRLRRRLYRVSDAAPGGAARRRAWTGVRRL
jgi:hypothetical protein